MSFLAHRKNTYEVTFLVIAACASALLATGCKKATGSAGAAAAAYVGGQ